LRSDSGLVSVGVAAGALRGIERGRGASQESLRLSLRVDREAHEITVNLQVGEKSGRVFMEMQKPD